MLSSKLNAMSMGPLWVLRTREDVASDIDCCPICRQPWRQWSVEEPAVIAVLAAPIPDVSQQTLLENCLQAVGWLDRSSCFSLHASCSPDLTLALNALNEQMAEHVMVFGSATGQLMNPEFTGGKIIPYAHSRLVVTYHPEEMMANPNLKAQVWADLCLAKLGEE